MKTPHHTSANYSYSIHLSKFNKISKDKDKEDFFPFINLINQMKEEILNQVKQSEESMKAELRPATEETNTKTTT